RWPTFPRRRRRPRCGRRRRVAVKKLLALLAALLLAALVPGCGSQRDKGINSGRDRPQPPGKTEKGGAGAPPPAAGLSVRPLRRLLTALVDRQVAVLDRERQHAHGGRVAGPVAVVAQPGAVGLLVIEQGLVQVRAVVVPVVVAQLEGRLRAV